MATFVKPLTASATRTTPTKIRSNSELAWRRFKKNRLAMLGLITIILLLLMVIIGPFLYTASPIKTDPLQAYQKPFSKFFFGTDDVGRDVLARVLFGGRISLSVGIAAMAISITLGTIIGAFAGFFGGALDFALMRITDLFQALPIVPLLLLVTYLFRDTVRKTFGADLGIFMIIVGVIGALTWMTNARLVRSSFLALKEREFVEASRALGVNRLPIMFKHILPNSIGPIIVAATLNIGAAILTESTVSFLGLGFPSDVPTWGKLAADGKDWIDIAPHVILIPAFFIFLTALAVNFAGDGLRDALDPRRQG
ncbi:MAG: ABC transporter permease [Chloroflexi bacterium]|jgi:peptide/nickel transport system permease protein|nr:ABC transporter permease [Chloroflexota bacterium]